ILYPKMPPEILTAISLAVVFFNAASGSESYAIMKRIDYKSGLMFAAATIPGAIIGALNTSLVPRHLFNGIFAVVLVGGAIFLIIKPTMEERTRKTYGQHFLEARRHLEAIGGETYDYAFNPLVGIGISLFVGYISSFLGIGGGIIHVPVLIYALGFPVHVATATSHFILAIMALTGTLVHIWTGDLSTGVNQTLALAIGVLLGAPLGAQLSNRIRGPWIVRSLALALGLAGIRIGWMFFQG
ncbi:MAG TPA: sulfite exporter TauE/SafE family protein, partial [Desulfobaccales bacterium]|nr:sulfite exporter TauE/SafE family protein [Desulfobaccales bacterium]